MTKTLSPFLGEFSSTAMKIPFLYLKILL